MNYTRHWRAQIHNRLGSGIFIPKRQRLTDSDAPRGLSAISVRNNNIHNDLEDGIHLNGHATDPDLDLYPNIFLVHRFVLFCFVLFCFVLFCFVLFCFVLFCFVLFCFVLFCFVLF